MLIKRVSWKAIVKQAFEYFINGFLGCLLYLVISKLDLKIRNLSPASRVSSFDLKQILFSLPLSVKSAYEKWFLYFHDEMFHRNKLYLLLFVMTVLFIGMEVAILELINMQFTMLETLFSGVICMGQTETDTGI